MIYYYSATGNTGFAAKMLGLYLNDEVVDISKEDRGSTEVNTCKKSIGILFPIYCWGIPPVVNKFLDSLMKIVNKDTYLWGVCTCGDEAGIAMRLLNKEIKKRRGSEADALFSIIMPNTYVLLPGFDVDKPEVQNTKLAEAPEKLQMIAGVIKKRERSVYDVHEGSLPTLRTKLLYPLFKKWGVDPKLWRATDKCIGCGKCAISCPASNIVMKDKHPLWKCNCYSCCACFHICPVNAVEYGKLTLNKSQYHGPQGSIEKWR